MKLYTSNTFFLSLILLFKCLKKGIETRMLIADADMPILMQNLKRIDLHFKL